MNHIHFGVQGLPAGSDTLLDIWQVEPPAGVAFGSGDPGPADHETITWSVTLPADSGAARQLLQTQAGLISQQQHQLGVAEQNLRKLNLTDLAGVAFTSSDGPAAESAEMTLRRNLAQLQAAQGGVDFGLGEWRSGWQRTVAEVEAQLGQVLALLKPTMQVETKVEAQQIARTILRWPGRVQTVSPNGLAAPLAQLHQQTLALALQSRLALLQLLATAGSGAALLAAKLSLPFPAGPLLAMPAAWRYLQDLRQQVQTFRRSNL